MGILKNDPLAFRVQIGLFALVGLLLRLEIYCMAEVFTLAVHHIRYCGGIPFARIALLFSGVFDPFTFKVRRWGARILLYLCFFAI